MRSDNLGSVVLLVSLVAILMVAVRQNLFRDINYMTKTLQISGHNFQYQIFPDRSRPIIFAEKEMGLRQAYPQLFNNFTNDDWSEFWDIIYGTHPMIEFKDKNLPLAERNYYVTEVQNNLIKRYPKEFSYFDVEAWKIFWKQIYGISPGIQALLEEGKQKVKSDARLETSIEKDTGKISTTIKGVKEQVEK